MALQARDTITDSKLLLRLGVVLALVLVGFVTHTVTDLEPSLVALLGAGAAIAVSGVPHAVYLEEVEWETLLFFAGLFVMVGALVNEGVIGDLADWVTDQVGDNHAVAALGMLIGSAVLSGVIDNIPYVATMSPLVFDLVGPGPGLPPQEQSLWWALALGADLGGNATAIGASANVVIVGIAKRNGHPISFWTFTRYGLVVTAVTIGLCIPYIAPALLRAGLIRLALSLQPFPREVDGFGEHRPPQVAVNGGDRHPLAEHLARRCERLADALLDELGHPLAGQLHHQAAGLDVVRRQEPPGQPHARVPHHRGPAHGRVVEQVVGQLVVEAPGVVVHQSAGGVKTPNWLPDGSRR